MMELEAEARLRKNGFLIRRSGVRVTPGAHSHFTSKMQLSEGELLELVISLVPNSHASKRTKTQSICQVFVKRSAPIVRSSLTTPNASGWIARLIPVTLAHSFWAVATFFLFGGPHLFVTAL
jgi:hypothetical protein